MSFSEVIRQVYTLLLCSGHYKWFSRRQPLRRRVGFKRKVTWHQEMRRDPWLPPPIDRPYSFQVDTTLWWSSPFDCIGRDPKLSEMQCSSSGADSWEVRGGRKEISGSWDIPSVIRPLVLGDHIALPLCFMLTHIGIKKGDPEHYKIIPPGPALVLVQSIW